MLAVEANPVAQTPSVTFHPAITSVEQLCRWVEECGYHCAGRSVPGYVCEPLEDRSRSMVADMPNRSWPCSSSPIAIWSLLGDRIFGGTPDALRDARVALAVRPLAVVVFYAWQVFFKGAFYGPKAKTLDMMVLVAVAIGTGWIYSVAATLWIGLRHSGFRRRRPLRSYQPKGVATPSERAPRGPASARSDRYPWTA